MSPVESTPTRAAASSIARGNPSTRRQIWAMSSSSPSGSNVADARPARSTNRATDAQVVASAGVASGPGSARDARRMTASPSMPRGSRLVASTTTVAEARVRPSTSAPAASITCSQLSITTRQRRAPNVATITSRRSASRIARAPTADTAAASTAPPSRHAERSTKNTESNASAAIVATVTARRVLPQPPPPVTQITRRSSSRPRNIAVSSSRPTNDVNDDGSPPVDPMPPVSSPRRARGSADRQMLWTVDASYRRHDTPSVTTTTRRTTWNTPMLCASAARSTT